MNNLMITMMSKSMTMTQAPADTRKQERTLEGIDANNYNNKRSIAAMEEATLVTPMEKTQGQSKRYNHVQDEYPYPDDDDPQL